MIDTQTIDKNKKKAFFLTVLTILLIFCSFVAIQELGISDIKATIKKTHPGYLLLSTFFMSLAFYCMGLRWRSLMPIRPPSLELSGLICAGLLLNYAAPGPLGELSTAWFASKRYPVSLSTALASGVVARLIGLITAATIGGLIWLFFPLSIDPKLHILIQFTSLFSLCMGIGLLSILLFPKMWLYLAQKLERKTEKQHLIFKIQKKVLNGIADLCRSIASLTSEKGSSYFGALLWSFCAHSCVVLGILFLAVSLGTTFSFVGIVFTYCVTTAGAVLLFALPGSYIGWDALFLGLLLSAAHIPQAESIAIVGIVRLQQLGYMLLGGISLNWLLDQSLPHQKDF